MLVNYLGNTLVLGLVICVLIYVVYRLNLLDAEVRYLANSSQWTPEPPQPIFVPPDDMEGVFSGPSRITTPDAMTSFEPHESMSQEELGTSLPAAPKSTPQGLPRPGASHQALAAEAAMASEAAEAAMASEAAMAAEAAAEGVQVDDDEELPPPPPPKNEKVRRKRRE